ncbi:MAG: hypothetical protein ACXWU1_01215 [Allosphingosinicella sp.]
MKILFLAAALATATQGTGPSVAQFNSAMSAACPDHRPATRNVSCARVEEGSIQFACRYEMQEAGGAWSAHEAILQLAEGEWVWIDGPTRCSDEEEPELN